MNHLKTLLSKPILCGVDQLVANPGTAARSGAAAMVTNNVASTIAGISARAAMLEAGIPIVRLFTPEHGIDASGADGSPQPNHRDELTNLPVVSLYGSSFGPDARNLEGIDTVYFDIPDLGARFYTYLWTMTYVMEACAEHKKALVILDRPNPISGDFSYAEGPFQEADTMSFLGRWPIPVRHSCTLAELARYFQNQYLPDLDLTVIPVANWNRKEVPAHCGHPFRPTSPAIRNLDTAFLYPGMGLLEGIQVNEGRGTHHPFQCMGAPWLDALEIHSAFLGQPHPGLSAEPFSYTPASGIYAGQVCHGLRWTLTDIRAFRPVETGFRLLQYLITSHPKYCGERLYPTHANPSGSRHLDLLTGISGVWQRLQTGYFPTLAVADEWLGRMKPFLLYTE